MHTSGDTRDFIPHSELTHWLLSHFFVNINCVQQEHICSTLSLIAQVEMGMRLQGKESSEQVSRIQLYGVAKSHFGNVTIFVSFGFYRFGSF